jgi:hypothetical protein
MKYAGTRRLGVRQSQREFRARASVSGNARSVYLANENDAEIATREHPSPQAPSLPLGLRVGGHLRRRAAGLCTVHAQ